MSVYAVINDTLISYFLYTVLSACISALEGIYLMCVQKKVCASVLHMDIGSGTKLFLNGVCFIALVDESNSTSVK